MSFRILQIQRHPNDQLVHLLENNVIGTPGKSMLYRHVDVRKKLQSIKKPLFCNLSIRDKLYGTICFCSRDVHIAGQSYQAFYIRYFAFQNELRSDAEQERRGKSSPLRQEVQDLFNGVGLETDGNLLLYAYVDDQNVRSDKLTREFGMARSGTFRVIPFSRLSPQKHREVEQLSGSELENFRGVLAEFYKDHQLVSFEHLMDSGCYFVIKDQDEIVCGVQGIKDSWEVLELPGWSGKFLMKIIPRIPVLKRLFNPKYRFVFLEALYCQPGYEHKLSQLFGTVLAHFQAHSAILCLDPSSEVYSMIQPIKKGLTHALFGEKSISIFVKTTNLNLIDTHRPFYVSGHDVL
jgi:hypothetical protein